MRCVLFLSIFAPLLGCRASLPNVNCVPFAVTNHHESDPEQIGGMVVPVLYKDRVRYLAVDTGSALTFLYLGRAGPEFRPRSGRVRIGAEWLTLPGRGLDPDDDTRIGIVGVLGADYFCTTPTLLDPSHGVITRFLHPDAIPPFEAAAIVPFENLSNHVILSLTVNGAKRRLMWDTGCPHLLLIGEAGEVSDEVVTGQDVEGGQFPMFLGRSNVAFDSESPRTLPTLRVPDFPYFEETVKALGGNIHGLAGQSVFGRRTLFFRPNENRILIGPVADPPRLLQASSQAGSSPPQLAPSARLR